MWWPPPNGRATTTSASTSTSAGTTTMTTDRPAKRPPRLDLSGTEWRLVLLTALAGGYAAVFALLAGGAPARSEPAAPPPSAPGVVWLDDLSPAERAHVALAVPLPRGLEIAPRVAPAAAPPIRALPARTR